jgi:DNA-binding protein Fis
MHRYTGKQLDKRPFYKKPDRKPAKETFDKTREILRCVFPLCKSGSKQIIIGMDSAYEFFPMVTIAKTGRPGVKLPHYAFKTLCDSVEYISDYFTEHHDGQTVVNLAPEIIVEFENQYGQRVITFCSNVSTNNSQRVTILQEHAKPDLPRLPAARDLHSGRPSFV